MQYERHFKVLICAPSFKDADLDWLRLQDIVRETEQLGFSVLVARSTDDAELAIETDAAIGCMVVDWGKKGLLSKPAGLIAHVRRRGIEMPILLMLRRTRLEDVPIEVLNHTDGTIFLSEETPEFTARNLTSRLRSYAATLKTPFFGALLDYTEQGNQLWTCPGHNGGTFYSKSPIGRIFVEHLGRDIFEADLDNSVLEMGDLLTHEGPALEAEKAAAKIFGAERTYFVLNGTSSSNKIVLGALVAPGDLVLFDRNNHKAAHHGALLLGGGTPIYLPTDRNAYGMVGPIDFDAFDETRIREAIRVNPLVTDPEAWQRERPFRVAVVEQCTYDGTIYDARHILSKLGHLCDYILFDEAWAGFMKFHPLFAGRFAMGLQPLGPDAPGIFATQSTHKQLASFSQASQIHIRDAHIKGQRRRVEARRFNESFLLHASTSPFYPIFASLDVGAHMMKGRSGTVLWDDTIRLGIELRKKLRNLAREYQIRESDPARRWFPDPFVPHTVSYQGPDDTHPKEIPWEDVPTDTLVANAAYWELSPGADWHGFTQVAPGYAMTDPNKLTLLLPGFDRLTGAYLEHGIPAVLLSEYLRENRIVPEKNDLHSVLFLLTPGIENSEAGTLLSWLVTFKRLHDENVALEDVVPRFVAKRPARYTGVGLRDLCGEMHRFYRDHDISRLQREQFAAEHLPVQVMSPQDAAQRLTRNQVDYLPLTEVRGRTAATLMLVYPPGIAVIVPGERIGSNAAPMIDYLLAFEALENRFPGLSTEIQGVYREKQPDGSIRFHTYVVAEH
ncbi:MAG: Orn/Lys/Arg decarboxylase N-terminal domain-containing protein [Janthinobacterium lividum]